MNEYPENPEPNGIKRRVFIKRSAGTVLAYGTASLLMGSHADAEEEPLFSGFQDFWKDYQYYFKKNLRDWKDYYDHYRDYLPDWVPLP